MAIDKTKILDDVKALQGIEDTQFDEVINIFIEIAIGKLLELRYPFDFEKTENDIEDRFQSWITRATSSIYDSQGQGNINQFSQNGVQVTYHRLEEGIDTGLIKSVMPRVGVPK